MTGADFKHRLNATVSDSDTYDWSCPKA